MTRGIETEPVSIPLIKQGCMQRMIKLAADQALQQRQDRSLYYFLPRIASLAAFATRNFTTRFAGILISAPV